METDHFYSQEWSDNETINETEIGNATGDDTNICISEKVGDDYLIELYRERKFLYDKKDRDFKDNEMKNNAWEEISTIMTKDKNLGNHYTAEYCKKRITTLREQYVKFKKEYDLKSGSASCTKKKSSLLSQFSFINEYIQRRRTLTNVKKNISPQTSSTFPNSMYSNVAARQETKITETNNNVIKKDSELSSSSEDNNKHDSSEDHTFYEKPSKVTRTAKKNFIKKSNENNDDLQELTKAAINICNHLQSDSTSIRFNINENVSSKSAEQAFAEFVTFSLQRMEESERSIRRNKIFENLTAPLNQLL